MYTEPLYSAQQIRTIEAELVRRGDVSLTQLMTRAGAAVWQLAQRLQPHPEHLVVVAGAGNNGGDGWVVAKLAVQAGCQVTVFFEPPATALAQQAHAQLVALGSADDRLKLRALNDIAGLTELATTARLLIVDALLGTGINRAAQGDYARAIAVINALPVARKTVVSADCPSGVDASTGEVYEDAVKADYTVSFIAGKAGLYTGPALTYTGSVRCANLGLTNALVAECLREPPLAITSPLPPLRRVLPERAVNAHKGSSGHVLVVGGQAGMAGAAALAGRAALAVGAGKVTIACAPANVTAIAAQAPELMVRGIEQAADLQPLLAQATQVVIGPGLGQEAWGYACWRQVIAAALPVVIDADGLQLLAKHPVVAASEWVLTPHPGEAGALLQQTAVRINVDRYRSVKQLQQRYHRGNFALHVVLKGAGSLLAGCDNEPVWVNQTGSPALAVAGTGDVLSGVIAGVLAQLPAAQRTSGIKLALALHGRAGERAAQHQGVRGMQASDLLPLLRSELNGH